MKTQTSKPSTFSVPFPLNTAFSRIIQTGQFIRLSPKEHRTTAYHNHHNQELVFRYMPWKLAHSSRSDFLHSHHLQSMCHVFSSSQLLEPTFSLQKAFYPSASSQSQEPLTCSFRKGQHRVHNTPYSHGQHLHLFFVL